MKLITAQEEQLRQLEVERNELVARTQMLEQALAAAEADRAARLEVIERQGREFAQRMAEVEADRAARLEVIERQGREFAQRMAEVEADRVARLAVIERQGREFAQRIAEAEADRAARLQFMKRQGAEFSGAIATSQSIIRGQAHHLSQLWAAIIRLQGSRLYRLMRLGGAWRWMDSMLAPPVLGFEAAYAAMREPKKRGGVVPADGSAERLTEALRSQGIDVADYVLDIEDYHRFLESARYQDYAKYSEFLLNLSEKSLEHYLAAKLLDLGRDDVYIDVASGDSPVPEIYERLFGVPTYRQDLSYPPGVNGRRIGGSAAHMPVADGMASAMALHCSFEHFEGNADTVFIREAARVLRPGGRLFIGPLYLHEEYAIQTDPEVAAQEGVPIDPQAVVYAEPGWGNRHARFYDPAHFAQRIHHEAGPFRVRVYRVTNAHEIDPKCYLRFVAIFRKVAAELSH